MDLTTYPLLDSTVCTPVAALTAGSGILSAVGGHQSQAAAARASNEAAINNYEYQIAQRENEWRQTMTAWGHKRLQYKAQTGENYLAAQRGYQQGQQKLNEIYQKARFTNQDQINKMLGSQGKNYAAGATGQSAQRSNAMMLAALGRSQAQTAASLASARDANDFANEGIRNELISANREAYSQVALRPVAGIAPPAPVMQSGPSGLSLLGSIGGAVASGFGAMQGAPDSGELPGNTPPPTDFGKFDISPTWTGGAYQSPFGANSFDAFTQNNNLL